jgi:HSP20 family molecular chaperone IbpA
MSPEPDGKRYWCPNTNVFISKSGDLIIKVDLCGLRSEDVAITVENNKLRIRGVRHDAEANDASQLLVNEIPAGPFESVMEVPDGFDVSASSSAYRNGILRILIPRKGRPLADPGPPSRN